MNCLNSNLLTALSAILITSALADFNTLRLERDLKAAQGKISEFHDKAMAEALEAKKQALIAAETARIKAIELDSAKKKLSCP